MAQYRHSLPQLSGDVFLTDGGIETTLIFHENLDLPDFAAFDLLNHDEGYQALRKYYRTYATLARDYEVGFILESATWRANPEELGNQYQALRTRLNHLNVLGGCCGTDHRHLEAICKACVA